MLMLFSLSITIAGVSTAHAQTAETVQFQRTLEIRECSHRQKCVVVGKNANTTEAVKLTLHPYSKGGAKGLTDNVKQSVKNNTLFRSEIRVSTSSTKENEYFFYLMLRSGPTLKRHGKIKNITIHEIHRFEPITLIDDPIEANGKILQARLILSPVN